MTQIKPKTIYRCDYCSKEGDLKQLKAVYSIKVDASGMQRMGHEEIYIRREIEKDFCSLECITAWTKENLQGSKKPVFCPQCKKLLTFLVHPNEPLLYLRSHCECGAIVNPDDSQS